MRTVQPAHGRLHLPADQKVGVRIPPSAPLPTSEFPLKPLLTCAVPAPPASSRCPGVPRRVRGAWGKSGKRYLRRGSRGKIGGSAAAEASTRWRVRQCPWVGQALRRILGPGSVANGLAERERSVLISSDEYRRRKLPSYLSRGGWSSVRRGGGGSLRAVRYSLARHSCRHSVRHTVVGAFRLRLPGAVLVRGHGGRGRRLRVALASPVQAFHPR